MKYYDENAPFGSDRNQAFERKKRRAALYLNAHKELLEQEDYLKAYNKILDEYAREFAYNVLQKPIALVSVKEREAESSRLNFQAELLSKEEIEKFQNDAMYITDWVKSGKPLIIYKRSEN